MFSPDKASLNHGSYLVGVDKKTIKEKQQENHTSKYDNGISTVENGMVENGISQKKKDDVHTLASILRASHSSVALKTYFSINSTPLPYKEIIPDIRESNKEHCGDIKDIKGGDYDKIQGEDSKIMLEKSENKTESESLKTKAIDDISYNHTSTQKSNNKNRSQESLINNIIHNNSSPQKSNNKTEFSNKINEASILINSPTRTTNFMSSPKKRSNYLIQSPRKTGSSPLKTSSSSMSILGPVMSQLPPIGSPLPMGSPIGISTPNILGGMLSSRSNNINENKNNSNNVQQNQQKADYNIKRNDFVKGKDGVILYAITPADDELFCAKLEAVQELDFGQNVDINGDSNNKATDKIGQQAGKSEIAGQEKQEAADSANKQKVLKSNQQSDKKRPLQNTQQSKIAAAKAKTASQRSKSKEKWNKNKSTKGTKPNTNDAVLKTNGGSKTKSDGGSKTKSDYVNNNPDFLGNSKETHREMGFNNNSDKKDISAGEKANPLIAPGQTPVLNKSRLKEKYYPKQGNLSEVRKSFYILTGKMWKISQNQHIIRSSLKLIIQELVKIEKSNSSGESNSLGESK